MAKSKARRARRRKSTTRSKPRRKTASRKASRRKEPKAKRKARTGAKKKRTTAEGMRRALKMKQAAEEREERVHGARTEPNWPAQIPQAVEPDPTPNNIREQGDIANIIQNTTNRRAG